MGVVDRVWREYQCLTGALRSLARLTDIARNPQRTLPDVAEGLAERFGDRPALISEEETLTYRDYNARANRYARWAMAQGIGKGDVVALMMPNCPDYLAIWLGVARAGGVTALLNTNLTGTPLAHCINIVHPKLVLVDATLMEGFRTAEALLQGSPKLVCRGAQPEGWTDFRASAAGFSEAPVPAGERPSLTVNDYCLFIYTSGTTGLPKAANINHYRVQAIMAGFSAALKMTPEDRIYICLPFYHSSGGVIATGAALMAGGSAVIREKFSATQFWDDIVRHDCTVFQYIGELCRYLLNSPPHPKETAHKIRIICGNGLRPDIWERFQERFRIPKILEWYAATEGNAVLINFDGMPGSVGRIPRWAKRKFAIEIVEFDIDAEEPVRGPDGFCIKCGPNQPGEVISQIIDDPKKPSQRFEGYADPVATQKKILHDVFEKGDRWFRTGDLMRKDERGYFYFLDRIGDTFRWKGENVATSEVSEALTGFPGLKEANVYGVAVPGMEGRAGMAALVMDGPFDPAAFAAHVKDRLPPFSRPVFVRLTPEIAATSTFKQRKVDLVKDGFDPEKADGPVYMLDAAGQSYGRLDAEGFRRICSGAVKL